MNMVFLGMGQIFRCLWGFAVGEWVVVVLIVLGVDHDGPSRGKGAGVCTQAICLKDEAAKDGGDGNRLAVWQICDVWRHGGLWSRPIESNGLVFARGRKEVAGEKWWRLSGNCVYFVCKYN